MKFGMLSALCLVLIIDVRVSSPLADGERAVNQIGICENGQTPTVSAVNYIGFSIAKNIVEPGNMFFSPLGLSMALGMAYLGARGNTAQEMENALGYRSSNISEHQVHEGVRQLCVDTIQQAVDFGYSLSIANGLFHQNGSQMNKEFVDDVHRYYHGDALSLNIANEPEEATEIINQWVKEKTFNKINQIYAEPIDPSTQVILTNAIYFKGTWKIGFPPALTYDGHFYITGQREGKIVPMMSLADEKFPYLKDEHTGYKYLEMPYKGDKVSMLFAVPLKYDQMANLDMNANLLCRIQSEMVETELENVIIPKFKLTYEKRLKDTLMSMGVVDAFTPGVADFSGITQNGLYVSDVIHKAVIEVNEKGSEAAAVSSVQIMPVSFREITEFVANRPFLFYIVDKTSRAILFSGKVADPS